VKRPLASVTGRALEDTEVQLTEVTDETEQMRPAIRLIRSDSHLAEAPGAPVDEHGRPKPDPRPWLRWRSQRKQRPWCDTDLFGVSGLELLDRLELPTPCAARVSSLRRLIEDVSRSPESGRSWARCLSPRWRRHPVPRRRAAGLPWPALGALDTA
jgi:hypothetical protein